MYGSQRNILNDLRDACVNGNFDFVKQFMDTTDTDVTQLNNIFILCVCAEGRFGIAELMLRDPRINPSFHENYAIQMAARYGHVDIVTLLSKDPRVDPSTTSNLAIVWAACFGHSDVVKILLRDQRVNASRAILNSNRTILLIDSEKYGYNNLMCKSLYETHHPGIVSLYKEREVYTNKLVSELRCMWMWEGVKDVIPVIRDYLLKVPLK